ncbi:MAG: hypothetical protein WBE37_01425 [Bryobacteraceae bacterium]
MNGAWLQQAILRLASLLVPTHERAEWMEEWQSELWYISPSRATLFCMGAFRDALWLRRNHYVPVTRTRIRLESPLSCLALLAALAALSVLFAFHILAPRLVPAAPWKGPDLGICVGVLTLSGLLLPPVLWVWRPPASRYSVSWSSTFRRGIFLVLKIVLLQSIVLCGSVVQMLPKPVAGFAGIAGAAAAIFAFRWVITDQQRRCPMCLRLLTKPIIIGTPSRTFLEWYGTESTCPHGHGLLHCSEISSSYSRPQWLNLGDSWSGLFAKGAGRHS